MRVKRFFSGAWWRIAAAILLFGSGGTMAVIGNYAQNLILMLLGIGLAAAGVLIFFKSWNITSARFIKKGDGEQPAGPVNALVLSPDSIEFKHVAEPLGHEQRCINNGRWYHVLAMGASGKLSEYKLPDDNVDKRHYDPREFANVVSMPANEKLFEPLPSMIKTIAIGVMGIVVIALGVVIMAMGG